MTEEAGKQEESKSEEDKDSVVRKFEPERKLAEGFIQTLVQWLPVGSSGFILASFLIQQNWLMVIVTLPITAIAVFWASFT